MDRVLSSIYRSSAQATSTHLLHSIVMLSSAPTAYTSCMYESHQSIYEVIFCLWNIFSLFSQKIWYVTSHLRNLEELDYLKRRGPAEGKMSDGEPGHKCSTTCAPASPSSIRSCWSPPQNTPSWTEVIIRWRPICASTQASGWVICAPLIAPATHLSLHVWSLGPHLCNPPFSHLHQA